MSDTTYRAPAVARALRILEHLARSAPAPRLSDLARDLGVGKSTLHGLLATLEAEGWVVRDGGRYRVGRGVLDLARDAFGLWEVEHLARPFMERVAGRVGESVFVGVPRDDRVVIRGCVPGGDEMQVTARAGVALPLFATATGKVVLAGMAPPDAVRRVRAAALEPFTDRTITDPDRLLDEVAAVRKRGYATDDEEYLRGIRAVAAPVRRGGRTVGLLWVAGFAGRLTDGRMDRAAAELVDAAGLVGRLLQAGPGRVTGPS